MTVQQNRAGRGAGHLGDDYGRPLAVPDDLDTGTGRRVDPHPIGDERRGALHVAVLSPRWIERG